MTDETKAAVTASETPWTTGAVVRDYGEPVSLEAAECQFSVLDGPDGAPVAYVYREEDARLIAAAPKLYAALAEMTPRGLNSDNANIPDDLVIPVDMTMGEIRRARAALHRANPALSAGGDA